MRIKRLNKSDLRVLGWCVLFAGTIWLIRTLSEVVPVTLHLPVVAENSDPSEHQWVSQPDTLVIHTRSSGFSMLGFLLRGKEGPLTLEVDKSRGEQYKLFFPITDLNKELRRATKGVRLDDARFSSDTLVLTKRSHNDESGKP